MNTKSNELPVLRFTTDSGSEYVHYPLIYYGLPEEFKLLARKEFRESEEKKISGLQMLKDHSKRKNLRNIPDYLLVATLRVSKYDIKKSKNKLEEFIKKRKEIADLLIKTDLKKIELVLDNFSCGMLPYRDKHGNAIIYTRPDGLDLNLHSMEDTGVVCMLLLLFILQFPITTVSGLSCLLDCKHPSITYIYPLVQTARRFMLYPISFPIRISKVNALNPFAAAYWLYKVASPFFPEKIVKRVRFLPKGYDVLEEEYNKNILPEVFGGNTGPLSNSHYKEKVLEFAMKFISEYE